jgi:hypothetical protein
MIYLEARLIFLGVSRLSGPDVNSPRNTINGGFD